MASRSSVVATLVVAALGLAGCPLEARADSEIDRRSLRGLSGITVVVENLDTDAASIISPDELKTRLELRLRQEGITVFGSDEIGRDPRMAWLYLNLTVLPLSEQSLSYACTCDLELYQTVWIVTTGQPTTSVDARTWNASGSVFRWGRSIIRARLFARVDAMLDEFVNAWLATHPKR